MIERRVLVRIVLLMAAVDARRRLVHQVQQLWRMLSAQEVVRVQFAQQVVCGVVARRLVVR
jgi:hypothetical protein